MKELRTLKMDSDFMDFMDTYKENSTIVGYIAVRKDVYEDFIKVLCVFPLKDKKLKYFLNLTPKQKTGYMSSYIMKVAKKMNVPNSMIELFQEIKKSAKLYRKDKPTPEEVGELFHSNTKEFLQKYKYVVKDETYLNELSRMTNKLCSAIFEQYDRTRNQIIKDEK
jgi:hypothetical protein